MVMPVALAREGFIDINESPEWNEEDNFLECIKKIFNFEDIDLQEFDGNTCKLISNDNPTNSIFIYTNDTGTFLYQITSASAVTHLNNFIWLCNTFQIENFDNLNNILNENRNVEITMLKNIMPIYNHIRGKERAIIGPKEKGNFIPHTSYKIPILEVGYNNADVGILKIKCYVNPTTRTDLYTLASDGSFNFFFPIFFGSVSNEDVVTSRIRYNNEVVDLYEVISKYSPNIKSIEFIPFLPTSVAFSNQGFYINKGASDFTTLEIGINGDDVKFTDCGIFIPIGYTTKLTSCENSISNDVVPKQLIFGGGVRISLSTPLGMIPSIIEAYNNDLYEDASSRTLCFGLVIKEEGFLIKGICDISSPPLYLNFYTDNAGQVFIQNLTTTAQELRSLERENIAKQQEREIGYNRAQISNALDTAVNTAQAAANSRGIIGRATAAAAAVAQGAVNAGKIALENEYDKAKIERDYNRAKIEYEDKIQTQSLLSKLTGKQISGQFSIIDMVGSYNYFNYYILIETNYNLNKVDSDNEVGFMKITTTQMDYDYSIDFVSKQSDYPNKLSIIGNPTTITIGNNLYLNSFSNITQALQNIFGYKSGNLYNQYNFLNMTYGLLSYSICFRLKNIYSKYDSENKILFSKTLLFQIRKNPQNYLTQ